jgi:hypothetical protein
MKWKIGFACLMAAAATAATAQAPAVDEASQKLAECVTVKATVEAATLSKWVAVEIASSMPAAGALTVDAEAAPRQGRGQDLYPPCDDGLLLIWPNPWPSRAADRHSVRRARRCRVWRELIATPGVNSAIVRSYAQTSTSRISSS